ncbi:hypothetical protein [Acidithiobacillus sp.]|jgi:hypothetical protein|uniref:hypothetical protein n=1 Tax=Acidithiobacillus sp. TaxID=1872118 RepID=UPI0025C09A3C|nr:hypothetical protein [Acidithiobacillus sp.]MCK9189113.1 hypothetical protein [Acidithiobacillus sp.]MCK9359556.1 hypothetical protein [Acidithiobacillus sp.]
MQIREEKEQSVEVILTAHEAVRIASNILENQKAAGPGAVALAELLQKEGFMATQPQAPDRYEWKTPDDMEHNA